MERNVAECSTMEWATRTSRGVNYVLLHPRHANFVQYIQVSTQRKNIDLIHIKRCRHVVGPST